MVKDVFTPNDTVIVNIPSTGSAFDLFDEQAEWVA